MIPSVIMLDDKKMRSVAKYKSREVSATKSLSYCKVALKYLEDVDGMYETNETIHDQHEFMMTRSSS